MPAKKIIRKVASKKVISKTVRKTNPLSLADNKYLVIMLMVCSLIPLAMIMQVFFSNFKSIAHSTMPEVFVGEEVPVFGSAIDLGFDISEKNYIEMEQSQSLNANKGFTVEAWIKPNQPLITGGLIVTKDNGRDTGFMLSLYNNKLSETEYITDYSFKVADTNLSYHGYRSIMTQYVYTPEEMTSWHHVAGVIHADGKMDIFVDGQRSTMNFNSINSVWASNLPIIIGGRKYYDGQADGNFSGLIDEVRISNVTRYSDNFEPQKAPFVSDINTQVLWSLDGTTIDTSANGRNGIVYGNVRYVDSSIVPINLATPSPTFSPTPSPIECSRGMVYPHYKNVRGVCTRIDECGRTTCNPLVTPRPTRPATVTRPSGKPAATIVIPRETQNPY
jgi:hypothetical protein